jgi:hypothetical protein
MRKVEQLTPEQVELMPVVRDDWLHYGLCHMVAHVLWRLGLIRSIEVLEGCDWCWRQVKR